MQNYPPSNLLYTVQQQFELYMQEEESLVQLYEQLDNLALTQNTNTLNQQWQHKIQELKMLINVQSKLQGREKVFQLQNAHQHQLKQVLKQWRMRVNKKPWNILNLKLINPDLTLPKVQQIFQIYPSIQVWYNRERILNNNILKQIGGLFYEGTYQHMFISSQHIEYEGEVTEHQPHLYHGKGIYICKKHDEILYIYQGDFQNGEYHGFGQLRNNKNVHYIGQFKNDYKSGKGVQITMTYKERKEKIVFVRQSMYDGQFVNGQRQGKGIEETKFGTYDGDWKDGVKWGKGIMSYKKGDRYNGNWQNNLFHGDGVYQEKGNCKYQGKFQNGLYHGEGKITYQNGDKYEGNYVDGKKHGYGIYTWADGDYYDGEWVDDFASGRGTSMIGTDFYDGQFLKGKRHGEGEITDEQGNIRVSKWEDGVELK